MKYKFYDRLLLFVAALLILLAGIGIFILGLQAGSIALTDERVLQVGRLPMLAVGLVLFLCGAYILSLPHKYRRQKDEFVVQQTASGELRISVKALEHLVQKSVATRDEITLKGMSISHQKSSVVIDLRVSLAANVSIPLAVNSLQKQVKQQLLASTGVDVKEVRVSVETADSNVKESPYLLQETAADSDMDAQGGALQEDEIKGAGL